VPGKYSLLEAINDPAELRALERKQLPQLAEELRSFLIESVSKSGGHLASNLGAVELTIALHYVFNTPDDRLVWDVGHQTYSHKILTGRREPWPPCASSAALPVSPSEPKANMTLSAPAIPAPRSAQRSAWQLRLRRKAATGAR